MHHSKLSPSFWTSGTRFVDKALITLSGLIIDNASYNRMKKVLEGKMTKPCKRFVKTTKPMDEAPLTYMVETKI